MGEVRERGRERGKGREARERDKGERQGREEGREGKDEEAREAEHTSNISKHHIARKGGRPAVLRLNFGRTSRMPSR
jgi:hypothetical protein